MAKIIHQVKNCFQQIPLLIITVLMCNCVYTVLTTNIAFQWKHYIGIIIILISILFLFFHFPRITKWVTLIGLIGATFNLVAYTAIIDYATLGGSIKGKGIDIIFQPYSLMILFLFIFFNLDFIKSIINKRPELS